MGADVLKVKEGCSGSGRYPERKETMKKQEKKPEQNKKQSKGETLSDIVLRSVKTAAKRIAEGFMGIQNKTQALVTLYKDTVVKAWQTDHKGESIDKMTPAFVDSVNAVLKPLLVSAMKWEETAIRARLSQLRKAAGLPMNSSKGKGKGKSKGNDKASGKQGVVSDGSDIESLQQDSISLTVGNDTHVVPLTGKDNKEIREELATVFASLLSGPHGALVALAMTDAQVMISKKTEQKRSRKAA